MRLETTEDVLALVDCSATSAALGAAFELGLFHLLAERPLEAREVGRELGIPGWRCGYWLALLEEAGLLSRAEGRDQPSPTGRSAILDAYGPDTWALLAQEAREAAPARHDLPLTLRLPGSAWAAQELERQGFLAAMTANPERARRFTRMLLEIHAPLAEAVAEELDLDGVERMMDLGGGSGVVSHALLRRHPGLSAVVVDIAPVCVAGREIAAERGMAERLSFHSADFLRDELPTGLDLVLECDVGVYGEELFRRIRAALRSGGRLAILDQLAPAPGVPPPARKLWAFQNAMEDPDFSFPTAAELTEQLSRAGLEVMFERPLLPASLPDARFLEGMRILQARR